MLDEAGLMTLVTQTATATGQALAAGGGVMEKRKNPVALPGYTIDAGDDKYKNATMKSSVPGKKLVLFDGKPKLEDVVHSRSIDDSYLIYKLAGIVQNNPDYISDFLVREDPNDKEGKHALVRLFSAEGNLQEIRVDISSCSDQGRACWVNVVEKAAAVLLTSYTGKTVPLRMTAMKENVDWSKMVLGKGTVDFRDIHNGTDKIADLLLFGTSGEEMDLTRGDKYDKDKTGIKRDLKSRYEAIGKILAYRDAKKIVIIDTCGKNQSAQPDGYSMQTTRFPDRVAGFLKGLSKYLVIGKGESINDKPTIRIRDTRSKEEHDITYEEFAIVVARVYVSGIEGMEGIIKPLRDMKK